MPTNTADQQLTMPVLADAADQAVSFSDYTTDVEVRLVHLYTDEADRTARNPSPANGQISFLTSPGRYDAWMPSTSSWWEMRPLYARKSTETQVVNGSTTFVDDDALLIPMQASARYTLNGMVVVDTSVAADIKFNWSGPAGFTMQRWYIIGADTSNAFTNLGASASGTTISRVGLGIGTFVFLPIVGIVLTSATAGNLQLRWAQNTSDAVNTRLKIDSWISLTRVG